MYKKREFIIPAISLAAFITLALIYVWLQPFNDAVRGFVGATLFRPFYIVAIFFHYLFETPLGALQTVIWGAAIAFAYKDKSGAVMLVAAVSAQSLITNAVKILSAIPRPPQEYFGVFYHTYAYPSGHTSTSLTFAILLTYLLCIKKKHNYGQAVSAIYIIFAILTPYTRLYLDVHQITDILGGWANGLFVSSLFMLLWHIISKPERQASHP